MKYHYTFYVGTDQLHVQPSEREVIGATSAIEYLVDEAAHVFGGATAFVARGAWKAPGTDQVLVEDTVVVRVLVEEYHDEKARKFAEWARDLLNQRSVLVEHGAITAQSVSAGAYFSLPRPPHAPFR